MYRIPGINKIKTRRLPIYGRKVGSVLLRVNINCIVERKSETNLWPELKSSHILACSRLRDSGEKSFRKRNAKKRSGWLYYLRAQASHIRFSYNLVWYKTPPSAGWTNGYILKSSCYFPHNFTSSSEFGLSSDWCNSFGMHKAWFPMIVRIVPYLIVPAV